MRTVVRVRILSAMATADDRWRVEVAQERGQVFYRILRDGQVLQPRVAIASVTRIFSDEGVDMSDLLEVPVNPAA
jgi:hypothetical protein